MIKMVMRMGMVLWAGSVTPAHGGRVVLSSYGGSFPYVATSNDTILVDTLSGTVTTLFKPGSVVTIPNGTSNVFVNLDNDTIVFDTDSNSTGSGEWGIRIGESSANPPNNVRIRRGGIRSHLFATGHGYSVPGGATPSGRNGLWVYTAVNLTVDTVNVKVDGHDANCVEFGAVGAGVTTGHTILFDSGTFTNYSQSFTSRETYGSACFFTDNFAGTGGAYTVKIKRVRIPLTPHVGIIAKGGAFIVESCLIAPDARNRYWDTTACFASNSCGVGQSSANPYAILGRQIGRGSKIQYNTISSGDLNYGSRGIMIDGINQNSRSDDSVIIRGNVVDCQQGKSGEPSDAGGVCRVLRIRSDVPGVPLDAVKLVITGNSFTASADSSGSTNHIGSDNAILHFSLGQSDSAEILVERNTFRGRSLSSAGTNVDLFFLGGSAPLSPGRLTIRENRWIGSQTIIRFGDEDNTAGASNIQFVRDTFQLYDTTLATGDPSVKLSGPLTFGVGWSGSSATGNVVRDGAFIQNSGYTNQARDTNIVFAGVEPGSIRIERTCSLYVRGSNGVPVNNATVRLTNALGVNVFSGTTNGAGWATPVVIYWYEEENDPTSADSIGFNPFSAVAKMGSDSTVESKTIGYARSQYIDTLTLAGSFASGQPDSNQVRRYGRVQLGRGRW